MKPGDVKKNLAIPENVPTERGLYHGWHINATYPAGTGCIWRLKHQCNILVTWEIIYSSSSMCQTLCQGQAFTLYVGDWLYYWAPIFTGPHLPTLQIKVSPSVRAPKWRQRACDEHTVWVRTKPQSFRACLSQQHNPACSGWQRILSNLNNSWSRYYHFHLRNKKTDTQRNSLSCPITHN